MVFPILPGLDQVDQHIFPQHGRIRIAPDILRRIDAEHDLGV